MIALDLRGQYETSGPNEPGAYAIAELGADVAAVIDAVAARVSASGAGANGGRGPVHVMGHSFGGLVVRETVLSGASGIGSLTLMSSGPARLTGPASAELTGLIASLDGGSPDALRRAIERTWDAALAPQAIAAGVDPQIIAFLRERMLRNSPIGLRTMAQYLLSAPDHTAELARHIEAPVLVLYGEDDDKSEPAAQEEMAARLSAERVCIPGAAHSPAVDAPETTASALNAFWHAAEAAANGRGRAAGRDGRAGQRAARDAGLLSPETLRPARRTPLADPAPLRGPKPGAPEHGCPP